MIKSLTIPQNAILIGLRTWYQYNVYDSLWLPGDLNSVEAVVGQADDSEVSIMHFLLFVYIIIVPLCHCLVKYTDREVNSTLISNLPYSD